MARRMFSSIFFFPERSPETGNSAWSEASPPLFTIENGLFVTGWEREDPLEEARDSLIPIFFASIEKPCKVELPSMVRELLDANLYAISSI